MKSLLRTVLRAAARAALISAISTVVKELIGGAARKRNAIDVEATESAEPAMSAGRTRELWPAVPVNPNR